VVVAGVDVVDTVGMVVVVIVGTGVDVVDDAEVVVPGWV